MVDYKQVNLKPGTRENITLHLKAEAGITPPEAFFSALVDAIAAFNATKEITQTSKPAPTRKSIQEALKSANELNEKLRSLDGNSQRLLSQTKFGGVANLQDAHLSKIIDALTEIAQQADKFPKRGRLFDHARIGLAINVAEAINAHLTITATATSYGPYESVLEMILEHELGEDPRKVNDLVCRAIREMKHKINVENEFKIKNENSVKSE